MDQDQRLPIIMPKYDLLEYSDNFSITSGSLRNFYRDERNDSAIENNDDGNKTNKNKTLTSKFFQYKTKIIGRTPVDNNTLDKEVVVPLKNLSNFWRFLDLLLIDYEKAVDLSWSKEYIIYEISITPRIPANPDVNPPVQEVAAIQTMGQYFK